METLREFADRNAGLLRRDVDAMMNGWDPAEYPYESLVLDGYLQDHPGLTDDQEWELVDELLEMLGR